jgi:hypothetical protein
MQAPARSENLHFNKPAFGYAERRLSHLQLPQLIFTVAE